MITDKRRLRIIWLAGFLLSGCASPTVMQSSQYKDGKLVKIRYSSLYIAKAEIAGGDVEVIGSASLKNPGLGYVIARSLKRSGPEEIELKAMLSLIFKNKTSEQARLEFDKATCRTNKYTRSLALKRKEIKLLPREVKVMKKFAFFEIPAYSVDFLLEININSKPYRLSFRRLSLEEFRKIDKK